MAHVSPFLTGLPSFAEACRAGLPEGVYAQDYEASVALVLMAQGRGGELLWANGRPSQILSGTGR